PPSVPPARLVARARPGRISSCTSEPLRRAASKPSPSSTPFTAGMDMSACARRPSSFASHDTWEPRPTGAPSAITSTTPPSVSPAALAASMRAIISCSAAASRQRTGLAPPLGAAGVRLGRHHVLPVLPIAIPYEHRDGGAEGLSGAHSREPLDLVRFDFHAGAAAVTAHAPLQLGVDALRRQGQPGGHPLEDRHQAASVLLSR